MDARQLRYFLAVVDEGGFGRAAERLFIAQPSLSQAIAGLERELGVSLFHRVGRSVVVSEAGRTLIGPARLVIRDLDAAKASVEALRGVRSGRLELTTMPSPGIEPLTTLITRFRERHPLVTLNVEGVFTPDEVVEAVRSGRCEIGLSGAREPVRVAGVEVLALEAQPLILIVSPLLDTFGDRDRLSGEDLSGHRIVASQPGSLMRWMVDDVLAGGVDCEIVVEVAHRTSILPMVMSGVGHAVLPSSWRRLAEQTGLRCLILTPEVVLHVALLSRPSGLTPAAQSFLDVARRYRDGHS